jgi:hypothetical protein
MSQQWNRSVNTMDRAKSNKSNFTAGCSAYINYKILISNEIFCYSIDSLGSQSCLLRRLSVLLSLDSVLAS